MKPSSSSSIPVSKKRTRLQLIMKIVAVLMIVMLTVPLLATFGF